MSARFCAVVFLDPAAVPLERAVDLTNAMGALALEGFHNATQWPAEFEGAAFGGAAYHGSSLLRQYAAGAVTPEEDGLLWRALMAHRLARLGE